MKHVKSITKAPLTAVISNLDVLLEAILDVLDIVRQSILASPWKIWDPDLGGTGT